MPGREELLGRMITVVRSTDPGLVDVSGEVLDETMKTLVLRLEDGRRLVVPKVAVTIRFELEGRPVEIDGKTILFRPEDRVKKVR
jgi:ribonuclease P protein subunit POP4